MSFSQQNSRGSGPPLDARLRPTPDYGTLGPGSDLAPGANQPTKSFAGRRSQVVAPWIAVLAGIVAALLVSSVRGAGGKHFSELLPGRTTQEAKSAADRGSVPRDLAHIDRLRPQAQAETLLELAVSRSDGAVDQISSRVDRWQGKISWDPQLATLTTAALNSNDMRVRESGIEVQLAAYGLAKDSTSLAALIADANSSDHARKIWALWSLGAMANRGVETNRVTEILISHLSDSDEDSRRWAVEALALVGSDSTISPLLQTLHDDNSPVVRERAACSLAESGMLTPEQRLTAVPKLIEYSDDPSLDARTHAWAFQALADITGQHLSNDSNQWRRWYAARN